MKPNPDFVRRSERISHANLLKLIGEIDGIALESDGPHTVTVIIEIGGSRVELIRDSGTNISHHITRIGIADALSPNAPAHRPGATTPTT